MANKPALIGTLVRTTVNAFFLCFFFGGCASSSLHVRVGSGGCAAACVWASSIICVTVGVVGATGFCGSCIICMTVGVVGPTGCCICSVIHKNVGEKGPTELDCVSGPDGGV